MSNLFSMRLVYIWFNLFILEIANYDELRQIICNNDCGHRETCAKDNCPSECCSLAILAPISTPLNDPTIIPSPFNHFDQNFQNQDPINSMMFPSQLNFNNMPPDCGNGCSNFCYPECSPNCCSSIKRSNILYRTHPYQNR